MKAKIKWNMRAAGREVGHVETVEIDTVFMQGVIKNRVATILETIEAPKPVVELERPRPGPRTKRRVSE